MSDLPPFQRHSATSRGAAVQIAPALNRLQSKVYGFIYNCGVTGATDEEIQTALAMNPSTQRPRRIELLEMKLISVATGTRKTRSNRQANVWIATVHIAPVQGRLL